MLDVDPTHRRAPTLRSRRALRPLLTRDADGLLWQFRRGPWAQRWGHKLPEVRLLDLPDEVRWEGLRLPV